MQMELHTSVSFPFKNLEEFLPPPSPPRSSFPLKLDIEIKFGRIGIVSLVFSGKTARLELDFGRKDGWKRIRWPRAYPVLGTKGAGVLKGVFPFQKGFLELMKIAERVGCNGLWWGFGEEFVSGFSWRCILWIRILQFLKQGVFVGCVVVRFVLKNFLSLRL